MRILNMRGAFARTEAMASSIVGMEESSNIFMDIITADPKERFTSLANKWLIFRGVATHGY